MLIGKKILLGITGSIAAYKSILLIRELVKLGAEVQVICTKSALEFVTPLTLATISGRPVLHDFVSNKSTGEWSNHVALGKWADLMVVAPLSASTLSKMASGQCDSLLLATYLSATCPILVAPAMDLDMFAHPTTSENLAKLKEHKVLIQDAETGSLASGLVGKGRMAEPEKLIETISELLSIKSTLAGKRVLITAGPTHEPIDPVRFIGNRSSGKMGYAIAEEALKRGAYVTLISGPVNLQVPAGAAVERVETAQEMFESVLRCAAASDVVIMAAAVADYTPSSVHSEKIKKGKVNLDTIELKGTEDILKALGSNKGTKKLIGFALETEHELENARKKLHTKNLDMLVLNSLRDEGAGFSFDTNKVTFVYPDRELNFELKTKHEVANDILSAVEQLF